MFARASKCRPSLAALAAYVTILSIGMLTLLQPPVTAYYIVVEPNELDCYHEYAEAHTKLGFSFEVMGETANDIDVTIHDPNKTVVHEEKNIDAGKYTIEAGMDGNYEFCFYNRVSQDTRRYVMFNIDESKAIAESNVAGAQLSEEEKKIAVMVRNLHMAALNSKHEATYLKERDKMHRKISESTNSTVFKWIVFESFLLLSVSLAQIWYVRRFFETRRKV